MPSSSGSCSVTLLGLSPAVSLTDSDPKPKSSTYPYNYFITPPQPEKKFQPLSLVAPLPTIASLSEFAQTLDQHDTERQLAWARATLNLADRKLKNIAKRQSPDPSLLPDPDLDRLLKLAIKQVLSVTTAPFNPLNPPKCVPEALYLCGTAYCPESDSLQPSNNDSEMAFRYFEKAANMGYAPAWFRLGRFCEAEEDYVSARECYDRGVRLVEKTCTYVRPPL